MNRFERIRFERGYTRKQVQHGAGISYPTIVRLETGVNKPTAPIAKALADFYGMTVQELLGLEDEPSESVAAVA